LHICQSTFKVPTKSTTKNYFLLFEQLLFLLTDCDFKTVTAVQLINSSYFLLKVMHPKYFIYIIKHLRSILININGKKLNQPYTNIVIRYIFSLSLYKKD
jgi:hypothetical protein